MDFTTSALAFVKHLDGFVCEVSSLDRIWSVFFPNRAGKWRHLHVQQYKDSHYLTRVGDEASIAHPEGVRKRLLAQDTIGIVPAYATLHRANQRAWAAADVFDVLHYADLGRFKRRIAPFVTWEPLPILRPGK